MSVGLALKSAVKSNEKLVNQKYATLKLSWKPYMIYNKYEYLIEKSFINILFGEFCSKFHTNINEEA